MFSRNRVVNDRLLRLMILANLYKLYSIIIYLDYLKITSDLRKLTKAWNRNFFFVAMIILQRFKQIRSSEFAIAKHDVCRNRSKYFHWVMAIFILE